MTFQCICVLYCYSQRDAIELQKEMQLEYGYTLAQMTEVAGLGSATAIVKACRNVIHCLLCVNCTFYTNIKHITPLLRQLHWLPVQRRVQFKIACLVHQSLASLAPPTYLLLTFISSLTMVVALCARLLIGL